MDLQLKTYIFENNFVESDGDGFFGLIFSCLRMKVSSGVMLRNTCLSINYTIHHAS